MDAGWSARRYASASRGTGYWPRACRLGNCSPEQGYCKGILDPATGRVSMPGCSGHASRTVLQNMWERERKRGGRRQLSFCMTAVGRLPASNKAAASGTEQAPAHPQLPPSLSVAPCLSQRPGGAIERGGPAPRAGGACPPPGPGAAAAPPAGAAAPARTCAAAYAGPHLHSRLHCCGCSSPGWRT